MVTVVVNTPLDIDSVARRVRHNRRVTPVGSRLVVVDADAGVVAARATPADLGLRNIGPGGHGLQDGALRASVQASLETRISTIDLSNDRQGKCKVLTSAPSLVRLLGMVKYPWALTVAADAKTAEMMENFILSSRR